MLLIIFLDEIWVPIQHRLEKTFHDLSIWHQVRYILRPVITMNDNLGNLASHIIAFLRAAKVEMEACVLEHYVIVVGLARTHNLTTKTHPTSMDSV